MFPRRPRQEIQAIFSSWLSQFLFSFLEISSPPRVKADFRPFFGTSAFSEEEHVGFVPEEGQGTREIQRTIGFESSKEKSRFPPCKENLQ